MPIPALIGGALIGGAASLLGSGISAVHSAGMTNAQLKAQAAENDKNRQWQADEWTRRFNAENQYNDPSAVIARLRAAGVNPAAAMGQLSGSGGLAAAGGSSTPTNVGGVSPVGYATPNFNEGFSQLAQGIAALKNSNVNEGMLDNKTRETDALVKAMMARAMSDEANAVLTETMNSIQQAYGGKKMDSEIARNLSAAQLAAEQGNSEVVKRLLMKAERHLAESKAVTEDASREIAISNLRKYGDVLDSEVSRNNASANASNASARVSNSLAETEDGLRSGKIEAQDLSNKVADIHRQLLNRENLRDAATHQDKLNAIVAQCEREGLINRKTAAEVRSAITDADWAEVRQFIGTLSEVVGSFTGAVNALNSSQRTRIADRMSRYRNNTQYEYRSINDDGSVSIERHNYYHD
ncbi:MAG: DNA pilot protein [Microviridae sp.]|nr:MAG: DNA pilot protein [Microviridae sp.]